MKNPYILMGNVVIHIHEYAAKLTETFYMLVSTSSTKRFMRSTLRCALSLTLPESVLHNSSNYTICFPTSRSNEC